MRAVRSFRNELDADIRVTVVQGSDGRVAIAISGPASRATNVVTKREAEEIYSALGEVLTRPSQRGDDK